jgi:hypothetical protein
VVIGGHRRFAGRGFALSLWVDPVAVVREDCAVVFQGAREGASKNRRCALQKKKH